MGPTDATFLAVRLHSDLLRKTAAASPDTSLRVLLSCHFHLFLHFLLFINIINHHHKYRNNLMSKDSLSLSLATPPVFGHVILFIRTFCNSRALSLDRIISPELLVRPISFYQSCKGVKMFETFTKIN